MKKFILKELLKPTLRRLGSMIAGALVTYGVAEDAAVAIQTGAVAALAVAIDLAMSYMERNNESSD